MKQLFVEYLRRTASSRTLRYFLNDFLKDRKDNEVSTYAAEMKDVIKTIETLRDAVGLRETVVVVENNELWNVSDYLVPNFINVFLNTKRIYLSDFYFRTRKPALVFDHSEAADGKILSPTLFNSLFERFNQNQENKLVVSNVSEEPIFVEDLEAIFVGDRMKKIGDGKIRKELVKFFDLKVAPNNEEGKSASLMLDPSPLVETYVPTDEEVISFLTLYNGGKNHEENHRNESFKRDDSGSN